MLSALWLRIGGKKCEIVIKITLQCKILYAHKYKLNFYGEMWTFEWLCEIGLFAVFIFCQQSHFRIFLSVKSVIKNVHMNSKTVDCL